VGTRAKSPQRAGRLGLGTGRGAKPLGVFLGSTGDSRPWGIGNSCGLVGGRDLATAAGFHYLGVMRRFVLILNRSAEVRISQRMA